MWNLSKFPFLLYYTSMTDNMADPRFLRIFVTGFVVWAGIFTAFIAFVDPYGLWNTPKIERINAYKPARANLDRQIKPLEVLRDQPKTIFLGTSRTQEGLDAFVLNGTKYAPAYNASIPGGSMLEEEALLNHYLEIDHALKHVVMEVFLYRLILGDNSAKSRSVWDLADNLMPLFFSVGALEKSLETLLMNYRGKHDLPSLDARGHWIPPQPYNADQNFNPSAYSDAIAEIHSKTTDLQIQDSALQALIRMREACKKRGVAFTLLFLPNHPWDDYRLLSLGYWSRVETMYRKLSDFGDVYSASQYNYFITEPTFDQLPEGKRMQYWADPIHFSTRLGNEILKAWAGLDGVRPKNFLIKITPENVEQVLKDRMAGLKGWMQENQKFIDTFERSRRFFCMDEQSCKNLRLTYAAPPATVLRGRLSGDVLKVDGENFQLRGGVGGSVDIARSFGSKVIMFGWAIDDRKGVRPAHPATGIAAVLNDDVIDVIPPESRRYDVEADFGKEAYPVGFRAAFSIPSPAKNDWVSQVRLFALTKDRYAVPISNNKTAPGVEFIQVPFPAVLH